MAWFHTYDTATPAGTDDPREADDRMREIKAAVQEIMDVEHDWTLTGTRLTGDGKHTDVTCDSIITDSIITKGPWADIRAYGADTSNADNASAIQDAFDSGKSVLIPEGEFIVLSQLTWTTDDATLMFVSHKSKIRAGVTFPVDTPIIHFSGAQGCSIYNLNLVAAQRATGVLLTDCGRMSFYSPKLSSCRNGDDNYAFDIIASTEHSGTIWVYSMHIYGSGESGGIRIQGNGWNVLDCGFRDIKIQHVRHGIYLKSDAYSCYFSNLMIDCTSTDAGTFAIKEETGADNHQNIFHDVHCENTSANGTGIDMQSTTSVSTVWDYWVDSFATATVFGNNISQKYNYRIDGVQLRSRNRILVLNGKFDGYSPDATMSWDDYRSVSVASGAWDKWDFILPLPHRSIINTISNQFATDDGSADLRMQIWKQSSSTDWVQVGADHDFTGNGPHTATIDYTIEQNYVVKVSILAKRGAGSYLYVYPLRVSADY